MSQHTPLPFVRPTDVELSAIMQAWREHVAAQLNTREPLSYDRWIARAQAAVAKARGTMSRTSSKRSEGER
jgi:hypothetical protein